MVTSRPYTRSAALCRDEGKVNNEVQEARIAHEDAITSVERAQEEYMQVGVRAVHIHGGRRACRLAFSRLKPVGVTQSRCSHG